MNGHTETLAVEICSGPLDGTGLQVAGGDFSVGHDASCDVRLPETPGTPAKVVIRYSIRPDGGVSLRADSDMEHDGSSSREVESAGEAVVVRIGTTDLCLTAAGSGEGPTAPAASGQSAAGEKKTCGHCHTENAAGARWCGGCGRDL